MHILLGIAIKEGENVNRGKKIENRFTQVLQNPRKLKKKRLQINANKSNELLIKLLSNYTYIHI